MVATLTDGPADAALTLVLAHGAGAPMDHPFMDFHARALAARGWRVVRFEFPYMERARELGKKRAPDKQAKLEARWREVVAQLAPARLVIGGKSLGGRIASLLVDELAVEGLVCLGYPFHPIGKPDKLRTAHLESLRSPALIVQGTRDPMGKREEVEGYSLAPGVELCWLPDGDHSFKPRKKSGRSQEDNWRDAVVAVDGFLSRRAA